MGRKVGEEFSTRGLLFGNFLIVIVCLKDFKMNKDCDNCYWLEPQFEDNDSHCKGCAYGPNGGSDTTKWLHVNDEPSVIPPLRQVGHSYP